MVLVPAGWMGTVLLAMESLAAPARGRDVFEALRAQVGRADQSLERERIMKLSKENSAIWNHRYSSLRKARIDS